MDAICNGCKCLTTERWPKGAEVARCFGAHNGPRCGRVVEYSQIGKIGTVHRPAWCQRKENTA